MSHSPVVWTPEYSVGHPLLDAQHQKLLQLCNLAAESIDDRSPEGIEAFHCILNDLTAYVREHFQTEERILEQRAYPALDAHRAMHMAYEEKLGSFLINATEGKIEKAALERYLSDWWREHILGADLAYARANAAGANAG